MIEPSLGTSVLAATVSASSRGAISVIDRFQFGHRNKEILSTNLYNNFVACLAALAPIIYLGLTGNLVAHIISPKIIFFALMSQLTANAFALAFRHMKIPAVIVVAKMSDLLIGPAIYLLFSQWSSLDFLFAVLTTAACLPVYMSARKNQQIHWRSAGIVLVLLVLQASFSPWYMSDVQSSSEQWLPFAGALILWRLVLSFIFMFHLLQSWHLFIPKMHLRFGGLLTTRAALTLTAQGAQVLALGSGRPLVAWSILNATGLFAVFLPSKSHRSVDVLIH